MTVHVFVEAEHEGALNLRLQWMSAEEFRSLIYFLVRRASDINKSCNFLRIFCIPPTSCLPCTKCASVHGFSKGSFLARKKRKNVHVEQFHTNDEGVERQGCQHNSTQLMKSLNKNDSVKEDVGILPAVCRLTHTTCHLAESLLFPNTDLTQNTPYQLLSRHRFR